MYAAEVKKKRGLIFFESGVLLRKQRSKKPRESQSPGEICKPIKTSNMFYNSIPNHGENSACRIKGRMCDIFYMETENKNGSL
jgi:hypothetical protein